MPKRDSPHPIPSREARLREVFTRLAQHVPCSTFEEAYEVLSSTLERVEDELTGIENNPDNWRNDGRMYPVQRDHFFEVPGHPAITRLRSKGHDIFISATGAMEITVRSTRVVVFATAGADGRGVWDDD